MAWRILIGEPGLETLVIEENGDFDLRVTPNYNDRGRQDYVEVFIDIVGEIVSGTPSVITDGIIDLMNEIVVNKLPRRVRLEQDGVVPVGFDFRPQLSIQGPRVEGIVTIPEDGSGESHWGFRGTIYVKLPGNNPFGVGALRTWIQVDKNREGEVIKKIWHAEAEHRTVQLAEAAVLNFKPPSDDVTESIKRFFEMSQVIGEWVWEAEEQVDPNSPDVISIEEDPPRITGNGKAYVEDTQVSDDPNDPPPPELHRRVRRAVVIEISGVVRAFTESAARQGVPPPHFEESNEFIRQSGDEPQFTPGIEGRLRDSEGNVLGTVWRMPYTEVWKYVGPIPFSFVPNHHDHDTVSVVDPPSDGAMGG